MGIQAAFLQSHTIRKQIYSVWLCTQHIYKQTVVVIYSECLNTFGLLHVAALTIMFICIRTITVSCMYVAMP